MERLHTTKRKEYGQIEGMIDGLQGMAHCAYDAPHSIDVLEKIYTNLISKVEEMTFDQKCEVLQAMALMQHMPTNNSEPLLGKLINNLDSMPFEQVENDLTYKQFMKLHDAYRSFIHESNTSGLNFKNKNLLLALQSANDTMAMYPEAPFGE